MRIVMMCTSARGTVGGMEAVFAQLAASLRERGHYVTELYNGEGPLRVEGRGTLRMHTPRSWHRIPTPASLWRCARTAHALAGVVREVSPDVVNFHFLSAESGYPLLLRRTFGYGVVLSAHGSDLMRPANAVDRTLLPYILRRADAVTVVSEPLAERAREMTTHAISPVVIPNGVDLAWWRDAGRADQNGSPTVLSVGRFARVKGQDILLHAFAEVVRQVPSARLVLVGDGETRGALEGLAGELGLGERVSFLGALPAEGVRDLLHRADVFALPSRSEGQPIAMLEAMASGIPCVATSVGGVPGVLDGAGLLVPPEDPLALGSSLIRVLSDPDEARRLRNDVRQRADRFSWDATADAYERVLWEASASRARNKGPSVHARFVAGTTHE